MVTQFKTLNGNTASFSCCFTSRICTAICSASCSGNSATMSPSEWMHSVDPVGSMGIRGPRGALGDAGTTWEQYGGFPKLGVPFFGGPCSKDCSILGSILRFPYFGKLPYLKSLSLSTGILRLYRFRNQKTLNPKPF